MSIEYVRSVVRLKSRHVVRLSRRSKILAWTAAMSVAVATAGVLNEDARHQLRLMYEEVWPTIAKIRDCRELLESYQPPVAPATSEELHSAIQRAAATSRLITGKDHTLQKSDPQSGVDIADAWGRPLYPESNQTERLSFVIRSCGQDGLARTQDDITEADGANRMRTRCRRVQQAGSLAILVAFILFAFWEHSLLQDLPLKVSVPVLLAFVTLLAGATTGHALGHFDPSYSVSSLPKTFAAVGILGSLFSCSLMMVKAEKRFARVLALPTGLLPLGLWLWLVW